MSYDVFISYRRQSAGFAAESLYQKINKELAGRVFMDTKGIKPGERIPDKLEDNLKQCRVLLVLVDSDWHNFWGKDESSQGNRPDWVLREIEAVMSRGMPILWIQLNNAKIPEGSDLPESIKELKEILAFQVRQSYFDTDVKIFISEYLLPLLSKDKNYNLLPTWAGKALVFLFVATLTSIVFLLINKPSAIEPAEPQVFRDCIVCPEMVKLEFRPFHMGSNTGNPNESPKREVKLTGRFALSVREVTWSEWNLCVVDGYCSSLPGKQSESEQPVSGVSWKEADSFTRWLSYKTNKTYRLPSEVEWEYAARFSSSELIDSVFNHSEASSVDSGDTNLGSLYHMIGNVLEWTADCGLPYQSVVQTADPVDDPKGCTQRVLRGGSWKNRLMEVTASSRKIVPLTARASDYGFRVARPM